MKTLGGYRLHERLGQGGMGTVFRAQPVEGGPARAIKLMAESLSAEGLVRFRREAEAMGRLQHPDLVKIHDWGNDQGHPFLVMDLLEGGNLHDLLRSEGPLPEEYAAQLCERLAEALEYAHSRGVVHRDVKPANVLLRKDGSPVLTDFGLARLLGRKTRLTQTGDLLGSPRYMAPEQALGRYQDIGPATDVYALGVTLFECLTGSLPFRSETVLGLLELLVHAAPPSPADLRPELNPALARICLRCLEKDPAKRFPSAAALADALAGATRGQPPTPRRRAPLAAGVLVLGATIAALAIVVGRGNQADGLPPPPAPASTPGGVGTPTAPDSPSPRLPAWVSELATDDRPPHPLPPGLRYTDTAWEVLNERDDSHLLWVPPGETVLPGPEGERVVAWVSGFFLGKHEVTNGQMLPFWRELGDVRADIEGLAEWASDPVVFEPWSRATAYCRRAGGRLPTEAEWRRAAFGDDGRPFPWGHAEASSRVAVVGSDQPRPQPKEDLPQAPSAWGCLGMGGNVLEWTSDWLAPLPRELQANPRGPALAELRQPEPRRVVMGSGVGVSPERAHVSSREGLPPEAHRASPYVGFRLCIPAAPLPQARLGPWQVEPYAFRPPAGVPMPPPPGEPDALMARSEHYELFEAPRLAFRWRTGGPGQPYGGEPALCPGLPSEGYGLRARTTVEIPAGRWLLHTVSDDGIRLRVDGELVLEDWTHHGEHPLQHGFVLHETREVELQVDYFENFGHATLWVELLPD